MSMTRRDYVAVAAILAKYADQAPEFVTAIAHDMADLMAVNPKFQRGTFLAAAGAAPDDDQPS